MNSALAYAFILLKVRPRSEHELLQRLRKKKFPELAIQQALSFLKAKHLVDDLEFAKIWIQSRIKKPLGFRRLKQELRIKGVSADLIDQAIEENKNRYDEREMIKNLIDRRILRLKHIDPLKAKRRVYAALLRRGFSVDLVQEILRGYWR